MKIFPIIKLFALHPALLSAHGKCYVNLLSEEIAKFFVVWKYRVLLGFLCLYLGMVAVIFLGIGIMLWALLPLGHWMSPWAYIGVPLFMIMVSVLFGCVALRYRTHEPSNLTRQLAEDIKLFSESSAS